ncbi:MAG TPA: Crp/Fnr family transcriptional regulator [Blastocatellia bacterium]|nr:Crp/Fnr family transcriptional regulator [Blastocatellia bacterium]
MHAVIDPTFLSRFLLFDGLTKEELSSLSHLLHQKVFPAGANLITAEQSGEVVYLIADGTVKIFLEREDGTEVILAILGNGDTVGEMSLIDNTNRCASVVTLEKSSLLWMDHSAFNNSLRQMPRIGCNLSTILARRLRLANEQIQALAALEVESRVARQILAFATQYGRETENGDIIIPIRLTQSDLAGLVGASRERINQVIVAYKERHYISVDQRYHIIIHNKAALLRNVVRC